MLQLRLTQNIAKDLKVDKLEEPVDPTNPFNDWFLNVFIVNRKKIAIFTHGLTKLSFFAHYSDIGGAKNLPVALRRHLTKYLKKINYSNLQGQVDSLFDGNYIFCKTVDKTVLGHMNDFIHAVKVHIEFSNTTGEHIGWEEITKRVQDTPMNSIGFTTPAELFVNCCCKLKH
ncbi:MAG: DUF6933 domain-containing protein [Candidatus Berkiellales bacterium]